MRSLIPWVRVIDDAMICSHLGVADEFDEYNTAHKKLNDLISWNIAVATDPATNGGYKLEKIKRRSALVPSHIALLCEAYDFGQFADDFNQPLALPIRAAIRKLLDEIYIKTYNSTKDKDDSEPLCSPTLTECPRCKNDIFKCDGVFKGESNG